MSDTAINSLIVEMESYLLENELPDPDYVAEWNTRFHSEVETAERGADWESIVTRAHALGEAIQKRIGGLNQEREQLLHDLSVQAQGQRALKGYSSGTR